MNQPVAGITLWESMVSKEKKWCKPMGYLASFTPFFQYGDLINNMNFMTDATYLPGQIIIQP